MGLIESREPQRVSLGLNSRNIGSPKLTHGAFSKAASPSA